MKYFEKCRVAGQEELIPGIFSLQLRTEKIASDAQPGQFVSVYCRDRSRMLPRPVSICEADASSGILRLVYRVTGPGTGTEEFSSLKAGDEVEVNGPLGNGFPLKEWEGKQVLLCGGGIGIPPMLFAAQKLQGTKTILLGYRDSRFLVPDFDGLGRMYIATEDGSFGSRGNVLDVLRAENLSFDAVFACGPKPMLRALKEYALQREIPAYLSLEERMGCGIGACLSCICATNEKDAHSQVKNKRICTEGPVFLSTEVEI